MKNRKWGYLALLLMTTLFVSACAVQRAAPPSFDLQPIAAGNWIKKVDSLYFILDASSSMDDAGKFEIARAIIDHFNKTMPPLDIQVALRSFGHHGNVSAKSSELMVKLRTYTRDAVSGGLAKISRAGGVSPLNRALKDASKDLLDIKSSIAMIIVSDGKDMGDSSLAAVKALKAAHPDRLCIYTVLVGNAADGRRLLSKIAGETSCGRPVTADSLATGAAMNDFVRQILLAGMADSDGDGVADDQDRCPNTTRGVTVGAEGCPLDSDGDGVADDQDHCPNTPRAVTVDPAGCPLDSDKDGVIDDHDRCPDTPRGRKVDTKGCPLPISALGPVTSKGTYVFKGIQFENNKADLKAGSYSTLNEIAEALQAEPGMKVEIQGHTDSRGSEEYNLGLSQKRAEAVKAYLVSKGVDGERMVARGYGATHPIASNKTEEGRASNRRVELKPLK